VRQIQNAFRHWIGQVASTRDQNEEIALYGPNQFDDLLYFWIPILFYKLDIFDNEEIPYIVVQYLLKYLQSLPQRLIVAM
jgi:hypothetical protein